MSVWKKNGFMTVLLIKDLAVEMRMEVSDRQETKELNDSQNIRFDEWD